MTIYPPPRVTRAPSATPSTRGPLSRHALLSLYLPAVAIAMGQGIAAPALPVLTKSFDVGFGEATLVSVVYAAGALAATLPTGHLIDRVGRRSVLLAGPILTAVASFLTAFWSPTFGWLLAWRFIAGAASQGWELARLAMIADSESTTERGRLLKWMYQISAAAALVAPSIGGVTGEVDIRIPFVLYGAFTLLAIVPSIWLLPETGREGPSDDTAAPGGRGKWRYVLGLLFQRELGAFMGAQFLANVARGLQVGGAMNLYIAYAYDASALTIGLLNTASGIVSAPFGFLSGSALDRWGRKATIVPGFALLFVAMLALAATAAFGSAFPVFVAAFLFMNAVQAITAGNMQVLGTDLAPPVARGRFIGAWRLIGRGGGAAGPAVFGWAADVAGYGPAFLVLAVCSLGVVALVAFGIGETIGRGIAVAPGADAEAPG